VSKSKKTKRRVAKRRAVARAPRRRKTTGRQVAVSKGTGLVFYDTACRALDKARTVNEVKEIKNQAHAMRIYAKQAKNKKLEADAYEVRQRASIKVGEMMEDQRKSVGLAKAGRKSKTIGVSETPITLAEAGIDKNLAREARKLAKLSPSEQENLIATTRERIEQGGIERVFGNTMHPYDERGLDLYETPEGAVRALLGVKRFEGTIWEPACGRGAIVRVLRDAGYPVIASDIVKYDRSVGVDFLADFLTVDRAPEGVSTALTNPPYMSADEFVRHALSLVPRVVMLLRLDFLEGETRCDILESGNLARVYVFRNRVPFRRDGWEKSGNKIAFAWFEWDRDHCGPPVIERISYERSANDVVAVEPEALADVIEQLPGVASDLDAAERDTAPPADPESAPAGQGDVIA
jgi:hypothetical protein